MENSDTILMLIKVIKEGDTSKFYTSRTWRRKASHIRKRDNDECQCCKSKGLFRKAECVHHKKEIKQYPELALTDDNLISLCSSCHNEIHEKFKYNSKRIKKRYANEEKW